MSDKDTILKQLDIIGVDAAFIIQEMFLGYKYRSIMVSYIMMMRIFQLNSLNYIMN